MSRRALWEMALKFSPGRSGKTTSKRGSNNSAAPSLRGLQKANSAIADSSVGLLAAGAVAVVPEAAHARLPQDETQKHTQYLRKPPNGAQNL